MTGVTQVTQGTKYDLSTEDAVWLACAIDGEGSVVPPPSQAVACYNSSIEFINNAKRILELLDVIYKFSSYEYKGHEKYGYQQLKLMYSIRVWRREEVIKILPVIIPYLIIPKKKEAAEKALTECKKSLEEEEKRFQNYSKILSLIEQELHTAPEIESITHIHAIHSRLDFLQKKGYTVKQLIPQSQFIIDKVGWKRTSKQIERKDFQRHKESVFA